MMPPNSVSRANTQRNQVLQINLCHNTFNSCRVNTVNHMLQPSCVHNVVVASLSQLLSSGALNSPTCMYKKTKVEKCFPSVLPPRTVFVSHGSVASDVGGRVEDLSKFQIDWMKLN